MKSPTIAERHYTCFDPEGHRHVVTVRVGRPREDPREGPWSCAISIRGLGARLRLSASGRDGVQALLRALARARHELLGLASRTGSRLVWESLDERLGLPGDPPPKPVRVQKAPRARWPGRPGQPRPGIPARAEERVTQVDEAGRKHSSELWLGGECVGRVGWSEAGVPVLAVGLKKGRPDGYTLEYHDDGAVSYAEPYVDGVPHGEAKQYDSRGRLLLVSPFERGTGVDYSGATRSSSSGGSRSPGASTSPPRGETRRSPSTGGRRTPPSGRCPSSSSA